MHNFLLLIIITPRRSSEKEEIIQAIFSFLFVLFLHLLLQLMGHEVLKLRQQLERLQTTQRHMLGEDLSQLTVPDLLQLEQQLDMGSSRVQERKKNCVFWYCGSRINSYSKKSRIFEER
jgi:hypothetical protein